MKDQRKKINYLMQSLGNANDENLEERARIISVIKALDPLLIKEETGDYDSELLEEMIGLLVKIVENALGTSYKDAPDKDPREYGEEIRHFNEMWNEKEEEEKEMTVEELREEIKNLSKDEQSFCEGSLCFAIEHKKELSSEGMPDAERIMRKVFETRDLDLDEFLEAEEFSVDKSEDESFLAGVVTTAKALEDMMEKNPLVEIMILANPKEFGNQFLAATKDSVKDVINREVNL